MARYGDLHCAQHNNEQFIGVLNSLIMPHHIKNMQLLGNFYFSFTSWQIYEADITQVLCMHDSKTPQTNAVSNMAIRMYHL